MISSRSNCQSFIVEKIELLPIAYPYREHLEYVVNETGIDLKAAQEIADELSQRLEDISLGIAPPINRVDCWLMAIASAALSGAPIVGRGIEASRKRMNLQAQAAKDASLKEEELIARSKFIDDVSFVANKIRDIPENELDGFITKVREIKHIQKNMQQIVSLLRNRELPNSPLERAAVVEIGSRVLFTK